MSEQEFELYLKLLSRCLNLTAAQREQIADELRDHLQERLEELAAAGVPREKAVLQALDEFGDAAVLAADFSAVAHLKRRRFLMRLSLGSVAALAAAMLVAFAFWPENRAVQGPTQLVAQENAKRSVPAPAGAVGGAQRKESKRPDVKRPVLAPVVVEPHPLSSDVGQDPRIEAALEANSDFVIEPQPLKDALEFIATRYQIPILLDTKTLDDASVDTSTEVKLKLPAQGLKLRQVLKWMLEPLNLAYDIRDGILSITTVEKVREHRYIVIYDCRDLIHIRSIYPRPIGQQKSDAGKGSGGGMFSVPSPSVEILRQFGGMAGGGKTTDKNNEHDKTRGSVDDIPLIRVIKYAGTPDDWAQEETPNDIITEFGGLLVINQTLSVHEEIKRILADLRRMKKEGAFATLDKDRASFSKPVSPATSAIVPGGEPKTDAVRPSPGGGATAAAEK